MRTVTAIEGPLMHKKFECDGDFATFVLPGQDPKPWNPYGRPSVLKTICYRILQLRCPGGKHSWVAMPEDSTTSPTKAYYAFLRETT